MAALSFSEQLHLLHSSLHLSHTPSVLPCRRAQHDTLRDFLRAHLLTGSGGGGGGGALYVSGSPGTGKTASVEHIVHELFGQRFHADAHAVDTGSSDGPKSRKKLLSKLSASSPHTGTASTTGGGPRVLYTNAMTFSARPSSLYQHLLAQARGIPADALEARARLPPPMECLQLLQDIWCPTTAQPCDENTHSGVNGSGSNKKKHPQVGTGSIASLGPSASPTRSSGSGGNGSGNGSGMTLLVLDELDALLRGANAAVLYHLLEWPRRPNSKLVLVAISNSINLLEQRLPELARRKAMPQNLVFTTYTTQELKQIVLDRCECIYTTEKRTEAVKEETAAITSASAIDTPTTTTAVVVATAPKTPSKGSSKKQQPSVDVPSEDVAAAAAPVTPARRGRSRGQAQEDAAEAPTPRTTRSAARRIPSQSPSSEDDPRAASEGAAKRGQKRKPDAPASASKPKDEETNEVAASPSEAPKKDAAAAAQTDEEAMDDIADLFAPSSARLDRVRAGVEAAAAASGDDPSAEEVRAPSPSLCITPRKRRKLPDSDDHTGAGESVTAASSTSATVAAVPTTPTAAAAPCSSPSRGVVIEPVTRERPIFDDAALDFLCMRVSKGSGDLRKVLEVLRKCIDGLTLEAETLKRMAETAGDASPSVHPSLQVSLPLMHSMVVGCMGGSGDQLALLRSLPVQQKVLLTIACLLSHLHGGREQLHAFPRAYAHFSAAFQLEPLRGADFADLLAALAAHRLTRMEKASGGGRGDGVSVSGGFKRGPGRPPGSGSSAFSAPGSGAGSGRGRSGSGASGRSAAVGAIQVCVSLGSLEAAFDEDALMQRLLSRGKALATSMLAATRAAADGASRAADYAPRNIEEP